MEKNDDQHQKHKPKREMDHFTRFMFGTRQPRETTHTQESPDQNEQSSFETRSNPIDDWMLGRSRKESFSGHRNTEKQSPTAQNKIVNYINNVDIGLLMETFDTIVTTTKQYKPILKGITPFFSKISGKFKK